MFAGSRFGGGRTKKKQGVVEKWKAFFEKYFGFGIAEFHAEGQERSVVYAIGPVCQMVAENTAPNGETK